MGCRRNGVTLNLTDGSLCNINNKAWASPENRPLMLKGIFEAKMNLKPA